MVDVLTWTIERRMRLTERAELLRKELAEVDAELGRLEAAELVFGQWAEATDRGRRPSGIVEPERVAAGPSRTHTSTTTCEFTMKRSHRRTRPRMPSVTGCRCPRVQPPSHIPACREGCRTLGAQRGPPCPLAVMHAA